MSTEIVAIGTATLDFIKALITAMGPPTLDLLKALIWPATVLIIVNMFKPRLKRLLKQVSDRVSNLERMKFGPYEMSFASALVVKDLSQNPDPKISQSKFRALVAEQGLQALGDPMTDVIALKLWRNKARAEQLAREIMESARLDGEEFSGAFMHYWTLRVEKILDTLLEIHYVDEKDGVYELTDSGRTIFKEVVERESEILARWKEERTSGF
jgi:hypothetical protein